MSKDRTHSQVVINLPDDVIVEMKEIAPALGYSSHIALARTYIGEGLRRDLARLDNSPVLRLTESLRKQGLSEKAILNVLSEAALKVA